MLPTANLEKSKKTSTPSPTHLYNNDVVYEIFTWLPAKSLMRFKSISKFWCTTISGDSYFTQLHRRRSGTRPGGEKLLLHHRNMFENKFITIDKYGRNHVMESYSHFYPYQVKVKAVDGFACLYSEIGSSLYASLLNLSTHESITLPQDSNFDKYSCQRSFYFIGFDSSQNLCKILRKIDQFGFELFEIYTVGEANNCWRVINSSPFECYNCCPYDSGVCVNSVIYWISTCWTVEDNECRSEFKIKAFDVSNEKFHLISIPQDCDVDHLRNVNGVLTLVCKFSILSCTIKLWKLEDYENQVWVMDSILVDLTKLSTWKIDSVVVGTIGSGEIRIIEKYLVDGIFEVTGLDYFKLDYYDRDVPGTYVENIMPLRSISN